jgi:hypothetical protein
MIKKLIRWLLNKDELDAIRKELVLLRLLLQTEIERNQPKRSHPVGPIGPVRNK